MNLMQQKYMLYHFFAKGQGVDISLRTTEPVMAASSSMSMLEKKAEELESLEERSAVEVDVRPTSSISVRDGDEGENGDTGVSAEAVLIKAKPLRKKLGIWEKCDDDRECKSKKCDLELGCVSTSKRANSEKWIYNPLTGKYVLRAGDVGQKIHKWKMVKGYSVAKIRRKLRERKERLAKKKKSSGGKKSGLKTGKKSATKSGRKKSGKRTEKKKMSGKGVPAGENRRDYVVNPLTGEWVKRSGRIGKKIVKWVSEGASDLAIKHRLRTITRDKSAKRSARRRAQRRREQAFMK